jgi:ATP-binding cassette subfamily G (WHITE) protein 1
VFAGRRGREVDKKTMDEEGNEAPPPAGFLAQCYLLYKRQLVSLKRDYFLLVVRLLCHLLIGIIFGYLYMGSGYRANGVLANYVYLYGSLLLIVYTGKMAVTLACEPPLPFPSLFFSYRTKLRTANNNSR